MRPTAVRTFTQSASLLSKRRLVLVQLKVDIPNLGKAGQFCLVHPGRMRNDLLPARKAIYKPVFDPRVRAQEHLLSEIAKQKALADMEREANIKRKLQPNLAESPQNQSANTQNDITRPNQEDNPNQETNVDNKLSPMHISSLRRSLEAVPTITFYRVTKDPIVTAFHHLPQPPVPIKDSITVSDVVDHIRTKYAAFYVDAKVENSQDSSNAIVLLSPEQVAAACEFSFAIPSESKDTHGDGIDNSGSIIKTGTYHLSAYMISEQVRISIPIIVLPPISERTSSTSSSSSIPGSTRSYSTRTSVGPVEKVIRSKIEAAFSPAHVEIRNDSSKHSHHAAMVAQGGGNGETHFFVHIISEKFEGMSHIKRHRAVNALLSHEFNSGLHALSLRTSTPAEHENALNKEDDDKPARWQRIANLLAGILASASAGYLVLYVDYGPKEHCFTSVRKAVLGPDAK